MIIDHIENLELTDGQAKNYANELNSINYLARGLGFLYTQVQRVEAEVIKRLPKGKQVCLFGNAPQMQGINQDLVACAFHWYAVTVCNYVKMVGWLANGGNSPSARDYLESVLPEVYVWRNKVGAHFARIDPMSEDTPADLALSVMFPISFDDDAFFAHSLKLTLTTGGNSSTSRGDMRWSLTHIHRNLIPRYWPEATASKKSKEIS
jgi:hypothetical protein